MDPRNAFTNAQQRDRGSFPVSAPARTVLPLASSGLGCRRQRSVPRCGFGARQSLYRGEDIAATGGNSPKPGFGHQRAPLPPHAPLLLATTVAWLIT